MGFFLHIITFVSIAIPNVLGFNMILGKAKVLHFGPLGTSIVAAYGIFVPLSAGASYPVAILLGLLLTLTVSAFFAWLAVRMEPDGMGVLSIAAHLAILTLVLNWSSVTRGALGIPNIPRIPFLEDEWPFSIFCLVTALVWIFLMVLLNRGSFGRKLSALAEHPWHARSLGVDQRLVYFAMFLIAGVGATISNLLYPQYVHLLYPTDFGFPFLIFSVMVIVAGKPGSVLGVSCSLLLLTMLKEGIRFLPFPASVLGPLRLLLFGAILLIAVWFRRDAIFPKRREI